MELLLERDRVTPEATLGELSIDGDFTCYTLELPIKDGLPGSAIPDGRYPVVLAPSPKFELSTDPCVATYAGEIPHLYHIPDRTNILIHWGNDEADTEGCILVGTSRSDAFVGNSRLAFSQLMEKLRAVPSADTTFITVRTIDGPAAT